MQKIACLILNIGIEYIKMEILFTVLEYLQANIYKISNAFMLDMLK